MPRAKKAPGTAVDKRNGQRVVIADPGAKVEPFDAPPGLTQNAYAAWEDFWRDRPALLLTPTSKVVLVRWIEAVSRYERAIKDADLEPLMPGQNTTIPNPLYKIADQALKVIESCEKQLGIGTLNATQLGIAAIAEQQRLSDLNARYEEPQAREEGNSDAAGRAAESGVPRTLAGATEIDPRLLSDDELLS